MRTKGVARLAEGLVEGLRQPEVARVHHQPVVGRGADAGQRARHGLGGAVAGGVVDEDRLEPVGLPRERGMGLAHEALEESVHVARRVVEEKGDRDAWRARGRLSGTRAHRATIGEKAVTIKPRGLRATLAPRGAGEEDRA